MYCSDIKFKKKENTERTYEITVIYDDEEKKGMLHLDIQNMKIYIYLDKRLNSISEKEKLLFSIMNNLHSVTSKYQLSLFEFSIVQFYKSKGEMKKTCTNLYYILDEWIDKMNEVIDSINNSYKMGIQ